ncbi:MAG: Hpt domain-containing protein [Chitinophagaceae bacterium]|nr:Hpt domain-containing protein [Oligoflexus sp.]
MKMSIAQKFYCALVLPLIGVSFVVTLMTHNGLESNAADLADSLRLQGKAHSILSYLQTQDEASMALLIDPNQLEVFSPKKIGAYDDHKSLLAELKLEVKSENIAQMVKELQNFDEQNLRPIDTKILELLFDNVDAARSLYFSSYEPMRVKYEEKIRALAALFDKNVETETERMRSRNFISIIQISLALLLGIGVVGTAITVLARQIEKSDSNTKSLLGALNEGLFFFDSKGIIPEERSQALKRIIPGSEKIRDLKEFVGAYSETPVANVQICLDMLWNNDTNEFMSDFESTVTFLPKRITTTDSKIIKLEYREIKSKNMTLERVVVVATDITERLRNEREATVQAERVRKISKAAGSRESYLNFINEAISIFKSADSIVNSPADPLLLKQLQRDLHTLKGSVATFEFNGLASEFHALESKLEEDSLVTPAVVQSWSYIKDQWKFETSDVAQVLGLESNRDAVSIAASKFKGLVEHAITSNDTALQNKLQDALRYPPSEVLAKYQTYIAKLSEKFDEKNVQISFQPDCSDVSYAEIQRLDSSFVHIFRNCFDHGIEDKEERNRIGKNSCGTISCAVYRTKNDWLHVIIKDDGNGIDGDRLADKAVAAGVWDKAKRAAATYQQKIELIFEANMSTRDIVTELSGRGVGMDAVAQALKKLGGTISIHSQRGLGTQFELDIPSSDTRESLNQLRLSEAS